MKYCVVLMLLAGVCTGCLTYEPELQDGGTDASDVSTGVAISNLRFGEAEGDSFDSMYGRITITRETKTLKLISAVDEFGPTYTFGFQFDYYSATPRPEFKLLVTMPSVPADHKAYGEDGFVMNDGTFVYRESQIFGHPEASHGGLQVFSPFDPPGEWRFDFYLNDILLESVTANVVRPEEVE